jgi:hypothetical protein
LKGEALERFAEELIGSAWAEVPAPSPEEDARTRLRQRVYLSHYASEPIGSWDARLVWELEAAHAEMSRLIMRENGKTPED